jgi:hypothetical protein
LSSFLRSGAPGLRQRPGFWRFQGLGFAWISSSEMSVFNRLHADGGAFSFCGASILRSPLPTSRPRDAFGSAFVSHDRMIATFLIISKRKAQRRFPKSSCRFLGHDRSPPSAQICGAATGAAVDACRMRRTTGTRTKPLAQWSALASLVLGLSMQPGSVDKYFRSLVSARQVPILSMCAVRTAD